MSAHDFPQCPVPGPRPAPSSTLGQVLSTYCVPGTVLGKGDAEMSGVPVLASCQHNTYAEETGVRTTVKQRLPEAGLGGHEAPLVTATPPPGKRGAVYSPFSDEKTQVQ